MNDEQRIKKMEDLITKKKAAGEKILFSLNSNSLSGSEIEESEPSSSALEEEESEQDNEY
jgi:hypothetical protein